MPFELERFEWRRRAHDVVDRRDGHGANGALLLVSAEGQLVVERIIMFVLIIEKDAIIVWKHDPLPPHILAASGF
jgi:hypothetical protein